jgi:hypothetical protein
MSNLKSRVLKIEQGKQSAGLVIIAVEDGKTTEEAFQRCLSDDSIKPKMVI